MHLLKLPSLILAPLIGGWLMLIVAAAPAGAGGLTFAHPYPEGSLVGTWATELSQCVGEGVGVPMEVIGEGKLGSQHTLPTALAYGQLDIAMLPASWMSDVWPAMGIFAHPGIVTNPEHVMLLAQDSHLMRRIDSLGSVKHGFHIAGLGWQYGALVGADQTNTGLRGKRIRTYDRQTGEILASIGANPLQLPAEDIIVAMEQGYIDGAVVGMELVKRFSKFGDGKTITWSNDFTPFTSPVAIIVSADTVRSWGDNLMEVIRDDCSHVTLEFNSRTHQNSLTTISRSADSGMNIHNYSDQERTDLNLVIGDKLEFISRDLDAESLLSVIREGYNQGSIED